MDNRNKDLVKMIFSGLEFYYNNELIIYLNFGNLDLSKFNVPLHKITFLEQGPIADYINNPEVIFQIN